jgi:DNA polymerase III delta subunit
MLTVFYGNDTVKVRLKAHDFVQSEKDKGAEIVDLEAEDLSPAQLTALAANSSLFGDKSLYIIDIASADKETKEGVMDVLPDLSRSANVFVVMEGPLLAAARKAYEAADGQIDEYKKKEDGGFNNFAIADALLKKDKKSLWLLLAEARLMGVADEETIGILWWQLKTMRLAAGSTSADMAGLKDFPYNKAKRALSKFKAREIEDLSQALLTVLHETRAGNGDLGVALERYVLSI